MSEEQHADRTVVVTGALSGIGRGIARRFESGGANFVADGQREPKQGARYDIRGTTLTDVELNPPVLGVEASHIDVGRNL